MENEPEVIREQMRTNRAALGEKLETLEHQVLDVAHAVSATVEDVTEGVRQTVRNVKDTFDLRGQIDRHPLAMASGSVGVGFLAGLLLHGQPDHGMVRNGAHAESKDARETAPASADKAGLLDESLAHVRQLALGSLLSVAREVIVQAVPRALGERVRATMQNATAHLGGRSSPKAVEPNPPLRGTTPKESNMKDSTKQKWEGRWEQLAGKAKQLWGKLTNDDIEKAKGDYESLIGAIKTRTGLEREAIEKQLNA